MYEWVLIHIRDELEKKGANIDFFNCLRYRHPEEANEVFLKCLNKGNYDLFISNFSEKELFVDTLKEVKKKGIPTVLLCFDNLVVPYQHLEIAPNFDITWLTSIETEWMFKKRGAKTIFLPYAANPDLITYKEEQVHGIGFAGSPYGSRANIINDLINNNIDIYCHYMPCHKREQENIDELLIDLEKVRYLNPCNDSKFNTFEKMIRFKEGRKIIEGYIANKIKPRHILEENNIFFHKEYMVKPKDIYKAYSKYSLALSSTTARNTGVLKKPLYICNLRSFEIPMAGGIQFCRYNPELAEYFEADKEIVFFETKEEMIEKAKYYLDDKRKEQRQQIRINARKRAENEHTWYNRFQKVFEELGIAKI